MDEYKNNSDDKNRYEKEEDKDDRPSGKRPEDRNDYSRMRPENHDDFDGKRYKDRGGSDNFNRQRYEDRGGSDSFNRNRYEDREDFDRRSESYGRPGDRYNDFRRDRGRGRGPSYRDNRGGYYYYGNRGPNERYGYNDDYDYYKPYKKPKSSKMSGGNKAAIIILILILCIVGLGYGCTRVFKGAVEDLGREGHIDYDYDYSDDYIGVVYLRGTISEGNSGDGYNQNWILDRVNSMREDDQNKGILLDIDTPGGSSFATKELYDALLRYKEETKRPVYAYLESQATSGGYYVAAAADKINANIETWTGSIGVRVGTFYDVSDLMAKYGIKAYTITSGKNKDMGAPYKPMTEEQVKILQNLVNESYDRFVKAVSAGRNLPEDKVKTLADGRIYSSSQAVENGMIDGISSLEEFQSQMLKEVYPDEEIDFEDMMYVEELSLIEDILGINFNDMAKASELNNLRDLMKLEGKVRIEYIADIKK